MEFDFEDLRPFNDSEAKDVLRSVSLDDLLPSVMHYLYPGRKVEEMRNQLLSLSTIRDFQEHIMVPGIREAVRKTSTNLTMKGLEKIQHNTKHIYIANHRDIVLDAALLDVYLIENGMDSLQITFGSNLMKGDFVVNIGKLNKMFRIMRGGNIRDFYRNSVEVSSYMRKMVCQENESVWIAQRNGRTKDGMDKTELGVLKMFALSSDKSFVDNLDELSITPVCISYEYEPCDFLKTAELYISRYQKYVKAENEDLNSILTGFKQYKGDIHLSITDPITRDELQRCDESDKNEKFEQLARLIDQRIDNCRTYYKTNYIAYDLLESSRPYDSKYTVAEKDDFIEYMETGLDNLGIAADKSELRDIFLHIYANCLISKNNKTR